MPKAHVSKIKSRSIMYDVSVIKYEAPLESLKKAVDLVNGLEGVSSTTKVFVKPNFWRASLR